MGSGKGTESGNSQLLFPDLSSSKKERKVKFDYRPLFIEPIHRETVFQNGDSQVGKTSDETQLLGCLYRSDRCISSRSDTSSIPKVSSICPRRSGLSLHGLTIRNVPKSVDIFKTDGRYSSVLTPTCHISLPIPRRLADQRSDSQPIDLSDKILHTNYSKSRFPAKSKEIGSASLSEIHLYRHGISDAAKFSQGSNGSCTEPNYDNQKISVIQTCIGTNFPFSFGQIQYYSKFCSPRQTSLTSPADVSFVCLETSYSSSQSSNYDQQARIQGWAKGAHPTNLSANSVVDKLVTFVLFCPPNRILVKLNVLFFFFFFDIRWVGCGGGGHGNLHPHAFYPIQSIYICMGVVAEGTGRLSRTLHI